MALTDQTLRASRWQRLCLMAALPAGLLCALCAVATPRDFWPAYLVAVLFWLGASLGCLGIALLHRLTGGGWGLAIARELVAGSVALVFAPPLLAVLLLGQSTLYAWGGSASSALLSPQQQVYFERLPLIGRAGAYLVVWLAGAWLVRRTYADLATQARALLPARLAAVALVAYWLTATFAIFDWLMSLEPDWSSTIYGALHTLGFAVTGMAVVVIARHFLQPLDRCEAAFLQASHDLGNLLLAFNLLWTYLAFSQWLIIWSADLPEETAWFQRRLAGAWGWFPPALIVLHFVLPFVLLLSLVLKRNSARLAGVAGLLLFARGLDLSWCVLPATSAGGWTVPCLMAAWLGLGGLWIACALGVWRTLPGLPAHSALPTAFPGAHNAEPAP